MTRISGRFLFVLFCLGTILSWGGSRPEAEAPDGRLADGRDFIYVCKDGGAGAKESPDQKGNSAADESFIPSARLSREGNVWRIRGQRNDVTLDLESLRLTVKTPNGTWPLRPSFEGDLALGDAGGKEIGRFRLSAAAQKQRRPYRSGFSNGCRGFAGGIPAASRAAHRRHGSVSLSRSTARTKTSSAGSRRKTAMFGCASCFGPPRSSPARSMRRSCPSCRECCCRNRGRARSRSMNRSATGAGCTCLGGDISRAGRRRWSFWRRRPTRESVSSTRPAARPGWTSAGSIRWAGGRIPARSGCVFWTRGNYVDLAKRYRKYAIESGHFVSLKEKIARNPLVGRLIGTPVVHTSILYHIQPASSYYDKKDPAKNHQLVTFDARAAELRALAGKGVERAYVHLDGWGLRGYDNLHPDVLPPCPEAGGWEGMKRFADACDGLGYVFAIHDQYRDYYLDGPTYNPRHGVMTEGGGRSFDSTWYGGVQTFLCSSLAPGYVRRNHSEILAHGVKMRGAYLDVFFRRPGRRMLQPRASRDARGKPSISG